MNILRNLSKDKKGVTALEYGLIAALIAGVIITALTTLGGDIKNNFNAIGGAVTSAQAKVGK